MLYVKRQKLDTVEDLRIALGNAIKLEFATIPPYLTALYSIKDGANLQIANIIRGIVIEEMLHLSLAANILNAVGGKPDFPGSVPKYPGKLPMNIGSEKGKPFIVPLRRMSIDTVQNVFMVIESPETPLEFEHEKMLEGVADDYHTIGEFYEAVAQLIRDLGPSIFTGDPQRQVTGWFGKDELFAIDGVAAAERAIHIIVTQGEGTPTSPAGGDGMVAHYYRFQQIVEGETLDVNPKAPNGYTWGAPPIPFDDKGVWPVVENAPDVALPADTPVAVASRQCDQSFSALVDGLQETFDGNPSHLNAAVGLMYTLRLQAQQLVQMPIADSKETAGPRFLYNAKTASG